MRPLCAVKDFLANVEVSVTNAVLSATTEKSKKERLRGGASSSSSSASSSSALAASSSSASRNEVNVRNAAQLAEMQGNIARFEAEIQQWAALAEKYLSKAGSSSSASDGAGAGAASSSSSSVKVNARKRKAPASSSSGSSSSSDAVAKPARVELTMDEPEDLPPDDEGSMDESMLAKFGLAGALGDDVSRALQEGNLRVSTAVVVTGSLQLLLVDS